MDFEDPPKSADAIPLERHGALLLLAARVAGEILFSTGPPVPQISVDKDLASIASFFPSLLVPLQPGEPMDFKAIPVYDSLLVLAAREVQRPLAEPLDIVELNDLFNRLVLMISFEKWSMLRQIPAAILDALPSSTTRYDMFLQPCGLSRIYPAVGDIALGLLKDQLLKPGEQTAFHNPVKLWALWSLLVAHHVKSITQGALPERILAVEKSGALVVSGLNLYYVLLSSLREKVHLSGTLKSLRDQVQIPLRKSLDEILALDASKTGLDEEALSASQAGAEIIVSALDRIDQATENDQDGDFKDWSGEEQQEMTEILPSSPW